MKLPISKTKDDLKLLKIKSPAFDHLKEIPINYSCEGDNINPPLTIDKYPPETKSLVLIVDDPDAPSQSFTHWLVWNIPPTHQIHENSVPGTQGVNDYTRQCYDGPCPPSGIHHYHFKIYALDKLLDIQSHTTKHQLEQAMSPHIIAFGEITGLYERKFI